MNTAALLRAAARVHLGADPASLSWHLERRCCLDCPDARHLPPFAPFRLPIHEREHLARNAGHRLPWWCWNVCTFHDERGRAVARWSPSSGLAIVERGRGGKRSGAGAPRHNRNALKHGRYSRDPKVRAAARRRNNQSKRRSTPERPASVLSFAPTTTATTPQQSNEISELAQQMETWGFWGAKAFIYRHYEARQAIREALIYLSTLDDGELAAIKRHGAFLRHLIHEHLAQQDGDAVACPYCRWGELRKETQTR